MGPTVSRPGPFSAPQGGVAPQLALHPGDHLQGVEGLGDIIVRADVQPQDLVRVLALGREEDDGDVAPLPQPGGGPNPVQLGHHNIHQDQVDLIPLHSLDGLQAVVCLQCAVALAGEVDVQRGYDVPIIVTDQDGVHNLLSPLLIWIFFCF